MHALHRRDHAELLEARYVSRIDVLCVLDAPAQVVLVGIVAEDALVDVEHLTIRAIANRVDVHLIVVLQRDARRRLDRRYRLERQSGARREIRVRLEQPGAVRA